MKQTDEQCFSNIPQEPTICSVSGWFTADYPHSTYTPPKGFKTCPYCEGKGYVTEEEFNKYWETKQNG